MFALKKNQVDLSNRVLKIRSTRDRFGERPPKTFSSSRDVPIFDFLVPVLENLLSLNDHDYLLVTRLHQPYRDNNCYTHEFWKPALTHLNLAYRRPYTARHTFATNMLYRELISPPLLAQILGHTTTQMIYDVYVRYIEQYQHEFDLSAQLYKRSI